MPLPYSNDLRQRIIRFYENNGDYAQREIAEEFGVSKSFVEKLLQRQRTTKSSDALPLGRGRTAILEHHQKTLQQLVAKQPDATLAEIQARLAKKTSVTVSQATVCRMLQRLRLGRKKSQNSPASKSARM